MGRIVRVHSLEESTGSVNRDNDRLENRRVCVIAGGDDAPRGHPDEHRTSTA